jgi:hypothetical protein
MAPAASLCLCGCLEYRVQLAAIFDHFPNTDESGRHDEAVAAAKFPALSGLVAQGNAALQQMAEFGFGVVDAPAAARGGPNAGKKLLAGITVIVPGGQLRLAAEDAIGIGPRLLRLDAGAKR